MANEGNPYAGVERKEGVTYGERDQLPQAALDDDMVSGDPGERVVCMHCDREFTLGEVVWHALECGNCGTSFEHGWSCPFAGCTGNPLDFIPADRC